MPATRPRPDFQFDTVLDAVSDLGMDPNGNSPVDDAFQSAVDDRTLIQYPPGTYLWTGPNEVEVDDFGVQGTGQSNADVRFVTPTGYPRDSGDNFWFLDVGRGNPVNNFLLENVTIDQYDDWETSMAVRLKARDGALIKDVHHRGWEGAEGDGGHGGLRLSPKEAGGSITLDGYVKDTRTHFVNYNKNPVDIYVNGGNPGFVNFINSRLENSGSNGIYAARLDPSSGGLRVENSVFRNTKVSSIRISGPNSWVNDSAFIFDEGYFDNVIDAADSQGYPGIRVETNPSTNGSGPTAGTAIRNSNFYCTAIPGRSAGLVQVENTHGGATIENCRFHNDSDDADTLNVEAADSRAGSPEAVTVRGCHFTGTSDTRHANSTSREGAAIFIGDNRDGSVVEDCCIGMDSGMDGIIVEGSSVEVRNTCVDIGGQRVVGASGSNITSGCSCVQARPQLPGTSTFDHMAVVQAAQNTGAVNYSFTTSGEIALFPFGEDAATEGFEQVTENADGSWTATGVVANGGADTFEFNGEMLSFSHDHSDPTAATLSVDGTVWQPPDETDQPAPPENFAATVTGQTTVLLEWSQPSRIPTPISHYNVYVDGELFTTTDALSIEIGGLSAGSHTVGVSTVDEDGRESGIATVQVGGGPPGETRRRLVTGAVLIGGAIAASRLRDRGR